MKKCVALLAVVYVALWCVGCGGETGPTMAPVTGKVTLDGEVVPAGSVVFYPENTEMPVSSALIQPDGTFELAAGESGTGAVLGNHRVTVIPPDPISFGTAKQVKVDIPEKYRMPDTSGLTQEVKEGPNTVQIDLKTE
jgi:hypothetical protein